MRTAGIYCAARQWRRPTRPECKRFSKPHSASTACRKRFVPTTERRLLRTRWRGVWWLKLGIVPERIAAGHPEQNGRHERMHRTLKQETAQPPAANRRKQQRALDG